MRTLVHTVENTNIAQQPFNQDSQTHTNKYIYRYSHRQTHHLPQYDPWASAGTGPRPSPTPSEYSHLTHWPRARRSAPPPHTPTVITHIFVHSYMHMISIHNSFIWHMWALYIHKYKLEQLQKMIHTHTYNSRIQSGLATHYRRPFINQALLTAQLLQSHAHTHPIDPPRELRY